MVEQKIENLTSGNPPFFTLYCLYSYLLITFYIELFNQFYDNLTHSSLMMSTKLFFQIIHRL